MGGSEKRRARRKPTDGVVEFYDAEGTLLVGVGRLLDISARGALVESALRLKVGQLLRARLQRAGRSTADWPVTVVRMRDKGAAILYGIQFNPKAGS